MSGSFHRGARFAGFILSIILLSSSLLWCQMFTRTSNIAPVRHAPDKEFHMVHLDLNFHFDIAKKEVFGVATEKIVPFLVDYKKVHLNAMEMKINKVMMGNENLKYQYDGKILTIDLNKPYGINDTLTYSVTYSTIPKKGIFFTLPNKAYPRRIPEIWSQSESEDAQYWYPCQDHPNDFSTSTLTATVPEGWVVVSNGALTKETTDKKDHSKTFTWTENKPHVVYLNSIIAGKYDILKAKWDNVPIYYYVEPEYAKYAMENFSHTPDILRYFSEVTGHLYEWEKLSLSTVQDFTEGGMENVSAITLTNTTLHDKNAEPQVNSTNLVSHETAHQWFGDLMTCRDWNDAWLNEGFAQFFEALYGQHAFGNDHYTYEMSQNHLQVITADKLERQATVYTRYNSPDDVFSVYIYQRGASILNMLRHMLGDQLFFKAIRLYVQRNQFHNVDTHDLERAFQAATGRNLNWFFREWIYKGGHPIFDVKYNYDQNAHKLLLTVDQTQKVDSLTPVYRVPVDIFIETPSQKITKTVWIDSLNNSYSFDVNEKPLMVNFDEGHYLLDEVNVKKTEPELVYQLKNDKDVVGRIWAADQLGNEKGDEAEKALAASLKDDSFWAVRSQCAVLLGKFVNDESKQALLSAVNDKDKRVQVSAINSLGNFKDAKIAKLLDERYHSAKNYFVRAAAVTSFEKIDSVKALSLIESALKVTSYEGTIKNAALEALAKIDSNKAYNQAVEFTTYGEPDQVRTRALFMLTQSSFNKDKTEKLCEKLVNDPYWIVSLIAVNGLGKLGGEDAIPVLQKVAHETTNFRIIEVAKRAIKEIENRGKEAGKP